MKKILLDSQYVSKQWYFGGSQRTSTKVVQIWGIYSNDVLITKVAGSNQLANLALGYFSHSEASLKGWDRIITQSKTLKDIKKLTL